jgi:hypothetical protein
MFAVIAVISVNTAKSSVRCSWRSVNLELINTRGRMVY